MLKGRPICRDFFQMTFCISNKPTIHTFATADQYEIHDRLTLSSPCVLWWLTRQLRSVFACHANTHPVTPLDRTVRVRTITISPKSALQSKGSELRFVNVPRKPISGSGQKKVLSFILVLRARKTRKRACKKDPGYHIPSKGPPKKNII